jgi:hypothetical protein
LIYLASKITIAFDLYVLNFANIFSKIIRYCPKGNYSCILSKYLTEGRKEMLLIESNLNSEISTLIENLPIESFLVVKPKHFDGTQVVQMFIDLAEIVVPSAIAAISTYLVTTRSSPTIKIKFNYENKIEAEIEGKLNDKMLQTNELYKEILELFKNQIKE